MNADEFKRRALEESQGAAALQKKVRGGWWQGGLVGESGGLED